MSRSHGQLRAVAVALAMVWGLAPLVSALHSDEHAHRYCLEHRAFEEGGSVGGGSSFTPDEPHLFALADAASLEDHVACSLAPLGSRFTSFEVSRTVHRAVGSMGCALPNHDTRGHLPIAYLDLAPKSSPPFAPTV